MTLGERMVWSATYVDALRRDTTSVDAARLAASEVKDLRRLGASQPLLSDDWEAQDMIDQMLRGVIEGDS